MSVRLDQLLITRGLFDSRAQARAAIEAGGVTVDGQVVRKAAAKVAEDAAIQAEAAHPSMSATDSYTTGSRQTRAWW